MARNPIKVSQLNSYIKRILQADPVLSSVYVRGEISNLKFHGSGHVYFTLKDETSRISCFLPSNVLSHIRYELSDGLSVNVSGYLYLYEKGGSYSINVNDLTVEGEGSLATAFLNLKTRLEEEGLFDESRKKPLPFFPENVAVVTSDTGAAVRDIIKVIKERNNIVNIYVCPVLVQGPSAAGEISQMIDKINRELPHIDVIITGRGGGSMEELWAFNEEAVARSIAASAIPVISAVGHETDFTIADFAADMRAPTPTAAAAMAVPDTGELRTYLRDLRCTACDTFEKYISNRETYLLAYSPEKLSSGVLSRIELAKLTSEKYMNELKSCMKTAVQELSGRIAALKETVDNLNPSRLMNIGYSAVMNKDGKLLYSISDINKGDMLDITMSDGHISCEVKATGGFDEQ